MTKLTAKKLKEILDYDPTTGEFRWKTRTAYCVVVGSIAGLKGKGDYRTVSILRQRHLLHRLAFLWMTGNWPGAEIDHINGKVWDNRWCNLRAATHQHNSFNSKRNKDKKLPKGIRFHNGSKKYEARICINYESRYLGLFEAPEDAHAAYIEAARKYHGEFARID